MIKRLFSKRSGFTLVEIIVAFAVFAIMSTMIVQLLNMISTQRRWNNEFSRNVDEQDGYLVTNEKLGYVEGKEDTGTLHFDFNGTKFDANYQMNGTSPTGDVDGLAYFVSSDADRDDDDDDDNKNNNDDDNIRDNTGAQTDRVDARITGTRGFDFISIDRVIKVNEYKDASGRTITVYAFELCAQAGSDMNTSDIPYANYRLYFYDKNGKKAEIVSANYLNISSPISNANDWKNLSSGSKSAISSSTGAVLDSPHANNKYTVSLTSANGIRIGSPFKPGAGSNNGSSSKYRCSQCGTIYQNSWDGWSNCPKATSGWDPCNPHLVPYVEAPAGSDDYTGSGVKFVSTNKTRIEISFYGDPQLTMNSFGSNTTNGTYRANATVGGINVGPNIYGAFPK